MSNTVPAATAVAATTVVAASPPGSTDEVRRRPGTARASDRYALVGALAGGIGLTVLLFQYLLPLNGPLGFVVCSWVCFLGLYALLVAQDENGLAVRDRLAAAVVHSLAALVVIALTFTVGYTLYQGVDALPHANFYTQDMSSADSLTPLVVGGVKHALVGSLEQIGIALAITVPLGVSCAVFLTEVPGRFARFVRTVVEAMTALPSVVAGLFIYVVVVNVVHWEQCGLAAGCALSVMMLPIIIRAGDVVLRLVPGSLKEASYALGAGRLRTVWRVVLPTARSGLTTAVILGTARGIGETSPVLLTSGYNKAFNADPLHGPQVSLPLLVFTLVRLPSKWQISRGFGAAAVLMLLVLALFLAARVLGGKAPGELSRRQLRRRATASARTATHYARRAAAVAAALALIATGVLFGGAPRAAAAAPYTSIDGAGSTWSSNAMDAWTTNVKQYGMTVNFAATGSSDGRTKFKNGANDFDVSEIPYGITDDGVYEAPPSRHFAYMPIVAGGTSFMYNLKINGQRVTNLRLSGDTIAGIFTGTITRWNDRAIADDNPSLVLPARQIVPVVRSDGSGTTAQLTTWLSKRETARWNAYCVKAGRSSPCGVTSFYPLVNGEGFQALGGSQNVSGFVAQDNNEGSITYVEYSYAVLTGFPVAKMLNTAGYYDAPTAQNVAVALTKAQINSDLTQNLDQVYDNPDPRTYPLSSYSYMILPTAVEDKFTKDKGNTLSAFAYYFLCQGQQDAPRLGYSPLPINLVEAALTQVRKIPGAEANQVNIAGCNNPTFSNDGTNTLAKTAPYPPASDKKPGTGTSVTGVGITSGGTGSSGGAATGGSGSTGGTTTGGAGGTGSSAGGSTGGSTAGSAGSGSASGDPGLVGGGGGSSGGSGSTSGGNPVIADPVTIAASSDGTQQHVLMAVAGLLLGSIVVLPPVLAGRAARRREVKR
ncbi:phosphate ABC transporter permease subunit PstA/phosphate ABC transporter phosphate-binding protein,TIGR00975 [Streptomyces sp. 846.5]|nr:phosphate ABC transporter permease PstA [Streptomyces sp. 846.5]TDT95721.1 phosphate ABC transporter permease subunit PstA/phosphate ABC transporter phosphate-binding protein,TIGR00975 [Streptomyces sp. 846.5]